MKIAVILFILMYVLIIFLPKYRVWAALGIAALFLVLGILPIGEVPAAINWNALMMMSGTMILVYYFIESGMPGKIADLLLGKIPFPPARNNILARSVLWTGQSGHGRPSGDSSGRRSYTGSSRPS